MTGVLHADAGAEELATLRITLFGVLLITFARIPMRQLASLPGELVEPTGVMRLLPLESILSSAGALWALQAALVVGCLACMLGTAGYRWIAVATVLLALFHDGALRSVAGFNIHVRLTLIYVVAVLAVAPAVDAYALRRRRRPPDGNGDVGLRYAGPMILMALVVTVTYSLVGTRRLLENGVSLFTSDTTTIWMVARSLQPSEYDFTAGLLLIDRPWLGALLTLGMLVTTLFELFSPLALRSRPFRWIWVAAVLSFHVGVLVAMNISFKENVVLVLLLFTPFTALVPRLVDRWASRQGKRRLPVRSRL